MATFRSDETTAVPVLRDDGTIYFRYAKTIGERLCEWAVASLWLLAGGVLVSTLLF